MGGQNPRLTSVVSAVYLRDDGRSLFLVADQCADPCEKTRLTRGLSVCKILDFGLLGFVGFWILSDQTDRTTGQTLRFLAPDAAERKKHPSGPPGMVRVRGHDGRLHHHRPERLVRDLLMCCVIVATTNIIIILTIIIVIIVIIIFVMACANLRGFQSKSSRDSENSLYRVSLRLGPHRIQRPDIAAKGRAVLHDVEGVGDSFPAKPGPK